MLLLQGEGEGYDCAQQSTLRLYTRKMLVPTLRHISGGSNLPAIAGQPNFCVICYVYMLKVWQWCKAHACAHRVSPMLGHNPLLCHSELARGSTTLDILLLRPPVPLVTCVEL